MNLMLLALIGGALLYVFRLNVVQSPQVLSEKGLRGDVFEAIDATTVHYPRLTTRLTSDKASEKYSFLGTVPAMKAWGTGRLASGLLTETYDVENEKYEITIAVPRDWIDDDQTQQIRLRIREMGERAAGHKDQLIESLINNGASTGFHSYDGVPFFSDAHVSHLSGSQSNKLTSSASTPASPTKAEFRVAIGQAIATMIAYVDDRGEQKRIQPTGLICVVPPAYYLTALEALALSLNPQADDELTLNVLRGVADVICLPGLTGDYFYLCKENTQVRPFIFQDRMPLEFGALEQNSETGFMQETFYYGVRARYTMTYGYWQYAIRTEFT
jgi:phage major head subunit gpT-like protein